MSKRKAHNRLTEYDVQKSCESMKMVLLEPYIDARTLHLMLCLVCNKRSRKSISSIRNGNGCKYCANNQLLDEKEIILELKSFGCKIPDMNKFKYSGQSTVLEGVYHANGAPARCKLSYLRKMFKETGFTSRISPGISNSQVWLNFVHFLWNKNHEIKKRIEWLGNRKEFDGFDADNKICWEFDGRYYHSVPSNEKRLLAEKNGYLFYSFNEDVFLNGRIDAARLFLSKIGCGKIDSILEYLTLLENNNELNRIYYEWCVSNNLLSSRLKQEQDLLNNLNNKKLPKKSIKEESKLYSVLISCCQQGPTYNREVHERARSLGYGNRLKVKIICIDTNAVFNSIQEASDVLNIDFRSISRVILGKQKRAGKLRFIKHPDSFR